MTLYKLFWNFCFHRHGFHSCFKFYMFEKNMKLSTWCPMMQIPFHDHFNYYPPIPHRNYGKKINEESVDRDLNILVSEDSKLGKTTDELIQSINRILTRTSFRDRCEKRITDILKCSIEETQRLCQKYPLLFYESIEDTVEKITYLIDSGVTERSILNCVEVLEFSYDDLKLKIDEMNSWQVNENEKSDLFPLIALELVYFCKISAVFKLEKDFVPKGNRLIYFAEKLQCPLEKFVHLALRYDHILFTDFKKLNKIFDIILGSAIKGEYITNKLWITSYSITKIEKWFDFKNTNQHSYNKRDKQFMHFFQKLVKKEINERAILKTNQSRKTFLSQKLNVDLEIIEHLMIIHPRIFNKDLTSMIETIDLLYSVGYTGTQICSVPDILSKNISLIKLRLNELENLGDNHPSIIILAYPNKKYQEYIRQLKE